MHIEPISNNIHFLEILWIFNSFFDQFDNKLYRTIKTSAWILKITFCKFITNQIAPVILVWMLSSYRWFMRAWYSLEADLNKITSRYNLPWSIRNVYAIAKIIIPIVKTKNFRRFILARNIWVQCWIYLFALIELKANRVSITTAFFLLKISFNNYLNWFNLMW